MVNKKLFNAAMLVSLLLCFWQGYAYAQQGMVAQVNKNTLSMGDNLVLNVGYLGPSTQEMPDFSALESDFEIISVHQPSTENYSVNGRSVSRIIWQIALEPRKAGDVTIPSFSLGGFQTQAINVRITGASQANQIYLETFVDKSKAYVLEAVKVTFRLSSKVNVNGLDRPDFAINDAEVVELPSQQYLREIDGESYQVIDFSYLVKSTRNQVVTIPELRWRIQYSRTQSQTGRYLQTIRRTEAKLIRIVDIPDTFPADKPWLPASELDISDKWPEGLTQLSVGEAVTRELRLEAKGLLPNELPVLHSNDQSANLRFYVDQPIDDQALSSEGVTSTRIEKAALIPSKEGQLEVPGVRIPWWNTKTDSLEYAELPARQIQVASSSANASNAEPKPERIETSDTQENSPSPLANPTSESTQHPSYLLYLSLLLNVVMLIAFICFWLMNKSKQESSPAPTLNNPAANDMPRISGIIDHYQQKSLAAFLASLSHWAKAKLGIPSLSALLKLAQQNECAELELAIKVSEASLYSNNPEQNSALPSSAELESSLKRLLNQYKKRSAPDDLVSF